MHWPNAPDTGFIVDVADALLAADKELSNPLPAWQTGNRQIEKRLVWPVLVEGEFVGLNLNLTAYPNDADYTDERFTITLNLPPCIWRLDFDPPYKRHRNPPGYGEEMGAFVVSGPSYHAWADNREFASPTRLPPRLRCARNLPSQIRSLRQAFPWFCDQANIRFSHEQMVDYPPRELLV